MTSGPAEEGAIESGAAPVAVIIGRCLLNARLSLSLNLEYQKSDTTTNPNNLTKTQHATTMASYLLNKLSQMDAQTLSSYLPQSLAGAVPYILTALTLYFSLMSLLSTGRFFFSIARFFAKWGALAALGLSAWATWNGEGDKVLNTASQFGRGGMGLAKWGWNFLEGNEKIGSLWQGSQPSSSGKRAKKSTSSTGAGRAARGSKKSGWDLEDIVQGVTGAAGGKSSDDVLGYVQNIAKSYLGADDTASATNGKKDSKGPLAGLGFDPMGWAGKMAFGQAKNAWDSFAEGLGDAGAKGNSRQR